MKKLALVFALLAVPAIAAADAPDVIINDAGQTATVDCGEGGKVIVNGASNVITITGGCAKVQINGSMNAVAIAAADKINVTGTNNKVTWSKGWTKKAPKISRSGVGNKVGHSK